MVSLFRRSSDDLGLLRSTVESLGATSVPGLAAALAWRERRTERALVEELARPGTPLTYDPALRVVRWAPPIEEAPAPATQPNVAPPPVGAPVRCSHPPPHPHARRGETELPILPRSFGRGLVRVSGRMPELRPTRDDSIP